MDIIVTMVEMIYTVDSSNAEPRYQDLLSRLSEGSIAVRGSAVFANLRR
jgi:hypothetical protein